MNCVEPESEVSDDESAKDQDSNGTITEDNLSSDEARSDND